MSGDFDSGKVYISGKAYNARRLQPSLASQWPSKVVTGGDITQDSHPFLSTLVRLSDRTGGMGLYKYQTGDPSNMVWDSTCETRYRGQLGRRPKQVTALSSVQTASIGDTFTRADSSSSLGTSSSGTAWTAYYGTWGISSNKGYLVTDGGGSTYANLAGFDLGTPELDMSVEVNSLMGQSGLFIRRSDNDNYIAVIIGTTNALGLSSDLVVRKVVAGVPTQLGSYVGNGGSIQGTVRVTANGTTIKVYVNGVERVSVTGESFNSGAGIHGILALRGINPYLGLWDNFALGDFQTVSVVTGLAHPYSTSGQRAYFILSNKSVKVDTTSDGSGTLTSVRSLADTPMSACQFTPSAAGSVSVDTNKLMLYVAQGRYIDRTETSTSGWTREDLTTAGSAQFLANWDGRLWRVTSKGELFASQAGHGSGAAGWTADATGEGMSIDGTYRYPTSLFVAKDASGETCLWMTTNDALWKHDDTSNKWAGPVLTWPRYPNGGKGSCEWKDRIYVPVGLDVYEVVPGSPNVINSIGPTHYDGLPAKCDGSITAMVPTHGYLAVSVTHSSNAAALEPRLFAYTGAQGGWHTIGVTSLSSQNGVTPSTAFFVDAWNQLRLYYQFQSDPTLYYQRVSTGVQNPRTNPTQEFETSTQYAYSPWYPGAREALKKVALRMILRTSGCSASDYIRISYGTDLSDDATWTTAGADITTNGQTVITFDVDADGYNEGKAFDFLRLRFEVIGSTASANPLLEYWEAEYLQSLPPVWAHRMELDLRDDLDNRSPWQQYDELRRLADPTQQTTLVPLTWDSSTSSPNKYMVRMSALQALDQESGADPRGRYLATFLEPVAV